MNSRLYYTTIWRIALGAYLGVVATVGFWPIPVDKPISAPLLSVLEYLHRQGAPGWIDYHFVEMSANVAMFVPFGIFSAMALPSKRGWHLLIYAVGASTVVELGQLLFLPERYYSLLDLVTNTLGAVIGIIVARRLFANDSSSQKVSA
ncbi:VanZ family protein [Paenarthrobacter sp. NPDC089316]|uniref:VanZ family protein n=2 Tax=unclassified Paenarthrobacter TaxID=2634190 RepID=UPI003440CED5